MPKSITQYRVFIGSPGGLQDERDRFRKTLELYTQHEAEPRGAAFHAVGWEETIGGVGRPQELINRDLGECDYAVFVLHDKWGSATGSGHTSGTEEEWNIAEELYEATKLRGIALFFKKVDDGKLKDPGDELKPVLAFKKKIETEKKYLFKNFEVVDQFCDELRAHLSKWLRDYETGGSAASPVRLSTLPDAEPARRVTADNEPNFDFWITTANNLLNAEPQARDYAAVRFCAERALGNAASDIEWARARNTLGTVYIYLNDLTASLAAYTEVADRLAPAADIEARRLYVRAMVSKGFGLGALNRGAEEIAVYDDVIARFGTAPELALREQVARALFNKGVRLAALNRGEEEIAVYNDVIARFGTAPELGLREPVARALFNKGARLGALNHGEEAIAVYDDVIARFGAASELGLREPVAKALVNKGVRLAALKRGAEEIAVYDDVIARFGTAPELALREQMAMALFNKGFSLAEFNRGAEAIAVYDDVIARFGTAPELALRGQVAKALFNKGVSLGALNRGEEEIAVYDDVIARFGTAPELALREHVARALVNKGVRLAALNRGKEAIAAYKEVIERFGQSEGAKLKRIVDDARQAFKPKESKSVRRKRHRKGGGK